MKKFPRPNGGGSVDEVAVSNAVSADEDPTPADEDAASDAVSADEDAASADSAPVLELGVAYTVDRHFVTNPKTQKPIGKPIEFDHVTIIELHEKTVLVKDGMTNKTHTLTDESFAYIKPLQILSRATRSRKKFSQGINKFTIIQKVSSRVVLAVCFAKI